MIRESLRTGHRRPVLQLPTGAGKTRVAAEIILGSLRREGRAIFVVPRLSLIEQTLAAFEHEGIWNVGVIQGAHFRTNPPAPVQIASAQTLARRDIPPASIIIIDECHLQFKSISEWIASPEWSETPFVGLSATPWSRGLGKSYDDLIMPVSIQQLIDEGWLSPFRVFAPPAPDLTGVRTTAGEFNEVDLSKACDKKEIVADVVRTWFEKGENRPTLCYGVDRKHAQHLQERFAEAGVAVEYIDCDTAIFDREEIFDRFRANETKLICNVATLDTGIDLDVRCIIDARPTKSRIRFVQTIGPGCGRPRGRII
jgi:DNA repair protein RadD